MTPNIQEQYVATSGQLTLDGYKLLSDMEARLAALETANAALVAQMALIASVTAPTGGATVDVESRAAVAAVIAGAA